ncbi:MAG TPA: ABC transporter permease subunit [Patescibacteria group bacterium]|nr:ABC transporter permease subunit [Patescibacteria group bacterium]
MKHVWSITKKELRTYFNSPIAYVFIVVFLMVGSWMFFRSFFSVGQASMRSYFFLLPWYFLFLIPAVTMRLWSEEKKLKTIEVLLTWPVRDWEVVLGKFLASVMFLAVALIFSISIPITIGRIGSLDWGIVAASYIGSLFLASAFLAMGLWVSSLTENQIVAFILAVVLSFVAYIIGEPLVLDILPQNLVPIFNHLGIGSHHESISRGVIDTRDVIYYLSLIFFFLFLNVRNLEKRKAG